MPGKEAQLTPLEARKQLLLLESELNRAQLLNELRDFKNEIHHLKHQMLEIGSIVALAAKLATAFSAIGQAFSNRNEGENEKPPWITRLLNGTKVGMSLWDLFRSCWRGT
jgi:hypothetical protein